jgi:hypothetical protein
MTVKKTLASILASLTLLLSSTNNPNVQACTGSKQHAMGDTGISLCDNANTVYWNQGRLALLKNPEVSFLQKIGEKDNFRYGQVANFAMPIGENAGIGVQYINSQTKNTNLYGTRTEDWQWVKLGAGVKVYDAKDSRVAIGAAITPKIMKEVIQYNPEWANGKKIENKKSTFDFEVSACIEGDNTFVKGDTLRFGCLMRSFGDFEGRHPEGYRPEGSYIFPTKIGDTTGAFGWYNLGGVKDENGNIGGGVRAGIEQKIGKKIALRAGYIDYGVNKDITFGIGFQGDKFGVDLNSSKERNNSIEVSYKF